MKIKALINCKGLGYDLKTGDETDLKKEIAEKLLKFGYVEKIKTSGK